MDRGYNAEMRIELLKQHFNTRCLTTSIYHLSSCLELMEEKTRAFNSIIFIVLLWMNTGEVQAASDLSANSQECRGYRDERK